MGENIHSLGALFETWRQQGCCEEPYEINHVTGHDGKSWWRSLWGHITKRTIPKTYLIAYGAKFVKTWMFASSPCPVLMRPTLPPLSSLPPTLSSLPPTPELGFVRFATTTSIHLLDKHEPVSEQLGLFEYRPYSDQGERYQCQWAIIGAGIMCRISHSRNPSRVKLVMLREQMELYDAWILFNTCTELRLCYVSTVKGQS